MNYTQALSNDEIMRYAPSAFAVTPYHAQSAKYAFIPTSAVIDGMRRAGFVPVKASQSRARLADKREFTKHMIRFRSERSLGQAAVVGDSVLESVLVNSHDGTSAYKLMCGVFRFVCSNGMVVADSLLESISVRHTGSVVEQVVAGSERILQSAPRVLDTIRQWEAIPLAPPEALALAESAHALRFDDADSKAAAVITPQALLAPRRRDDAGADLWHTFNRIQENAVKGQRGYSQEHGRVSSRAVKGIDGDVRLNRALWALAAKMAELKGGGAGA